MKKVYVYLVVCLLCAATASAQTYYWIGPSSGPGGNWDDNNNWSLSSGGSPVGAGIYPNNSTHNAVFDQNALVNVNVENIDLLSLTVTNTVTAKLFVGGTMNGPAINLFSTNPASPSLRINSGSRLEDSCATNIPFTVAFANDAKAIIDGTWYFAGATGVVGANGATFTLPGASDRSNRIDVNGSIVFRSGTLCNAQSNIQDYMYFNSGSLYWLDRNGGSSPNAHWNVNSTIKVTGVINAIPSISLGTLKEVGNIEYNCPSQITELSWSLPNQLVVKGNFNVLNTNNRILVLASNGTGGLNNFFYTVNGDLNTSGTSRVAIGKATNANKVVDFQVNGNLNISGSTFDLQTSNNVVSNPTTLRVKGDINHLGGTFGSSGIVTNTSVDLYIIELNGTSLQHIYSYNGIINNTSDDLSLRMNNASGATLLSPLTVGKISFNSANKGWLNTTADEYLTVNNTGTHSLVINSADNSGYVNGPVRRRTGSVSDYIIPTGKAGIYDPIQVRPSSNATSFYQSEYFANAFVNLTPISPLRGVSDEEYWQFNTITGVEAAIILTLNGPLAGALETDGIAISRYNGGGWIDYSGPGGTFIVPGTASSGTTQSTLAIQNGFYTFGYGLSAALPIKLLSFDAKKTSTTAALISWSIDQSSNPDYFEVQKSTDSRSFHTTGTVDAVALKVNYNYTDNQLATGTTYYRLKMKDTEGKITYSQVVAVLNGAKGVVLTSLMPTVVTSSATLTVSSTEKGTMQLVITDMYGRMVKQQIQAIGTGNQQIPLQLQQLPSGAYQVTAYMNKERIGTIRFVRQ